MRILDGLAASHAEGILHRDVKPQNILVERASGDPRLIDFGLARMEDLDTLTSTGQIPGTPLYMSPEQALAKPGAIDQRTDVYSAGAVLYELLSAAPPFEGEELARDFCIGSPTRIRDRCAHGARSCRARSS